KRCHDPFVALTAAALAAPDLRVGTAILLVAQRDPIVTAKAVASLDRISGGRFTLGIGFGWNQDEMEDHGVDYKHRRELGREVLPVAIVPAHGKLARSAELGVAECVFGLPSAPADAVLPVLDKYAAVLEERRR